MVVNCLPQALCANTSATRRKHILVGSTPASLLAKAAAAFTLGFERFFDLASLGVSR